MSKPLIVLDADVLGRQRTGDETYVSALLRELPQLDDGLRFAAVTRNPDCVPDGVEAIDSRQTAALRMSLVAAARCCAVCNRRPRAGALSPRGTQDRRRHDSRPLVRTRTKLMGFRDRFFQDDGAAFGSPYRPHHRLSSGRSGI
jgi:hypothetical protein